MSGPVAEVLGPVRLPGRDQVTAPVPGAIARRLVVALALAGPEGRSASSLADEVWGVDAPRNPRAALQMLVSRIRTGTADGLIASTPSGYRLVSSDLATAEALVSAAATLDAERVVDRTTTALAAWRGDPGADVDDDVLAFALSTRADRARSRLLELQVQALTALGRAAEGAAAAETLARLRPLDAAPVAMLMRALAAADRTPEALAAFAAHRSRLADELGADPAAELVALHAQLLRADGSRPAVMTGVRAPSTALLGRDEDLDRVGALVRSGRLTTVLGAGGLGKTRLVTELAMRVSGFDRIVFVELAGVTDPADLPTAVAAAVGDRASAVRLASATSRRPQDARGRVREALADTAALVVLDNCEHLIDAVAAESAALLADLPRTTLLTTSRIPLAIAGERVHPLPPLPAATAGAALFRERAEAARPGVRLDTDLLERVCARLDGLPLAIELAAARIRSMSLDDLDRRLDDRFAVLVGTDRSAPERHRTLLAVIDWSRRLLRPAEQEALGRLAAFPDGFTAHAAGAALGRDATDTLDELVTQSLLTVTEPPSGRTRYRMLETIRDFGLRTAEEGGRSALGTDGVDAWVLGFARRMLDQFARATRISDLAAVADELDTLLAAIRRPPAAREAVVIEAYAVLAFTWTVRDRNGEVPLHGGLMLEAWRGLGVREGPTATAALAGASLLAITASFTQRPQSLRALGLVRSILRGIPEADGTHWVGIARLTVAALEGGDLDPVLDRLADSSNPATAVVGLSIRGALVENRGQFDAALRLGEEALRIAVEHDLDWNRTVAETSIAHLLLQAGDHAGAAAHADIALDLIRRSGADDRQLQWIAAGALLGSGEHDRAEAAFRALLDADAGDPGPPSDPAGDLRQVLLSGLADVSTARGDIEEADRRWAAAAARGTRRPGGMAWTMLTTAGEIAASAELHRDPSAERLARAASLLRRLRGQLLALPRVAGPLDVPVFGAGLLGIATWLAWDGRPGATAEERTDAVELCGLAVACAARRDFVVLARAAERLRSLSPEAFDEARALPRDAALTRAELLLRRVRTQ